MGDLVRRDVTRIVDVVRIGVADTRDEADVLRIQGSYSGNDRANDVEMLGNSRMRAWRCWYGQERPLQYESESFMPFIIRSRFAVCVG